MIHSAAPGCRVPLGRSLYDLQWKPANGPAPWLELQTYWLQTSTTFINKDQEERGNKSFSSVTGDNAFFYRIGWPWPKFRGSRAKWRAKWKGVAIKYPIPIGWHDFEFWWFPRFWQQAAWRILFVNEEPFDLARMDVSCSKRFVDAPHWPICSDFDPSDYRRLFDFKWVFHGL